eukprot:TRINITY_DN1040_c0_g1_i1.p1 TRINITY_DN1040_c0_g1~~TRINITY_DN1040_c0_g1_i1.p1  ORF type:complete len:331 (-),score=63.21 TRINITY_DN1040_c0_g1_i1:161-1153(-)
MSSSSEAIKTIVTHSGSFHCDEVVACSMLSLTNQFKNSKIVRSRDPAVIAQGDIVVDVGGVYDPKTHRYDHHQSSFTDTLDENHTIKLSSAGLVYKHFGREIIQNVLGLSDIQTEVIFYKLYDKFIEALDGIDNGVERYPPEIKARYSVNTDLGSRIGNLNPQWNDPHPNVEAGFKKALEVGKAEFLEALTFYGNAWLPARTLVEQAIAERFNIHNTGEIIVLSKYCPWKDHLFTLEKEQGIENTIKFVLFSDNSGWRIQCVPINDSSFINRRGLHKAWRGRRDEELSKISEIDGCVFVHATGFIGGNLTYEGALQMALKTLKAPDSECN